MWTSGCFNFLNGNLDLTVAATDSSPIQFAASSSQQQPCSSMASIQSHFSKQMFISQGLALSELLSLPLFYSEQLSNSQIVFLISVID